MEHPYTQRFWRKVDKHGPTPKHRPDLGPCWMWIAGKSSDGYGSFKLHGRQVGAHRLSFLFATGIEPASGIVMHACDNPACVNPDHLSLGTTALNNADRNAKGRTASGERTGAYTQPERRPRGDRNGSRTKPDSRPRGDRHFTHTNPELVCRGSNHPNAKLTDADAIEIRRLATDGRSLLSIANSFGVSWQTVKRVVTGQRWAANLGIREAALRNAPAPADDEGDLS